MVGLYARDGHGKLTLKLAALRADWGVSVYHRSRDDDVED